MPKYLFDFELDQALRQRDGWAKRAAAAGKIPCIPGANGRDLFDLDEVVEFLKRQSAFTKQRGEQRSEEVAHV